MQIIFNIARRFGAPVAALYVAASVAEANQVTALEPVSKQTNTIEHLLPPTCSSSRTENIILKLYGQPSQDSSAYFKLTDCVKAMKRSVVGGCFEYDLKNGFYNSDEACIATTDKIERLERFLDDGGLPFSDLKKYGSFLELRKNAKDQDRTLLSVLEFLADKSLLKQNLIAALAEVTKDTSLDDEHRSFCFSSFYNALRHEKNEKLTPERVLAIAIGFQQDPERRKELLNRYAVVKCTTIRLTVPKGECLEVYGRDWWQVLVGAMMKANPAVIGSVLTVHRDESPLAAGYYGEEIPCKEATEYVLKAFSLYFSVEAGQAQENTQKKVTPSLSKEALDVRKQFNPKAVDVTYYPGGYKVPAEFVKLIGRFIEGSCHQELRSDEQSCCSTFKLRPS